MESPPILNIHDPKIFGPGWWLCKDILGEETRKKEHLLRSFKVVMTLADNHLPCEKCQVHALERLNIDPIINIKDPLKWVLDFHNHANSKTGKKEWTLEELIANIPVNMEKVEYVGPGVWIFVHTICFYGKNYIEKVAILEMLHILFERLCSSKKYSGCEYFFDPNNLNSLKKIALPSNSNTFFKWSVDFHNYVNKNLRKKEMVLDTVTRGYEEFCGGKESGGCP